MFQLYNTLSRTKETFNPRQDNRRVLMFSCGPSIYRRPHLGNFRSFVWEDVLQRYLEYLGFEVERVLNFTDVEDKAIEAAQAEGLTLAELTDPVVERFFGDASQLRIKLPDFIPRSSTSVDQAVKLIQVLLARGFAYWHKNSVFFNPMKFKGFGRLYRLDLSRWPKETRRFRKDTYPGRRWNLGDFILWHGYREGDRVSWDTEIGRGRPSWNIQDPAMVTKYLGYTIDIACGGIDNLYRHHDYNLAVIEAASGEDFARFWVHGEHLLVNGKKMSKSLGNIIYPDDLMTDGRTGQHVRFYLMYGHHRKRINFRLASFEETTRKLDQLKETVQELLALSSATQAGAPSKQADEWVPELLGRFGHSMDDDLDVRGALDAISELLCKLLVLKRKRQLGADNTRKIDQNLRRIDSVLQVIFS